MCSEIFSSQNSKFNCLIRQGEYETGHAISIRKHVCQDKIPTVTIPNVLYYPKYTQYLAYEYNY